MQIEQRDGEPILLLDVEGEALEDVAEKNLWSVVACFGTEDSTLGQCWGGDVRPAGAGAYCIAIRLETQEPELREQWGDAPLVMRVWWTSMMWKCELARVEVDWAALWSLVDAALAESATS